MPQAGALRFLSFWRHRFEKQVQKMPNVGLNEEGPRTRRSDCYCAGQGVRARTAGHPRPPRPQTRSRTPRRSHQPAPPLVRSARGFRLGCPFNTSQPGYSHWRARPIARHTLIDVHFVPCRHVLNVLNVVFILHRSTVCVQVTGQNNPNLTPRFPRTTTLRTNAIRTHQCAIPRAR
jgi:hypothetical protein